MKRGSRKVRAVRVWLGVLVGKGVLVAETASSSETASDAKALRGVVPHIGWEWAVRANRARKWPTWIERGKE